jgi:hypothetical protein
VKARFVYFLVILMFLGIASVAQAQATRTWVSGVGDDVNPCSRTAPCKTYAGAISKTAAGGIISTLDPGGFGAVTITKSITIEGTGTLASMLFSSVNGVNISAGVNDVIVLRDLLLNGAGTTLGVDGVRINTASEVVIENLRIQNFSGNGINVVTSALNQVVKVVVRNTEITNGLRGIQVLPTNGATCKLVVNGSMFTGHQGGSGIDIGGSNNTALISNSVMSHNNTGLQVQQASSTAFVDQSVISHNLTGVSSGGPVHLSNCMIVANTTNGLAGGSAQTGYFNNTIVGNTGDNTVTSSVNQQ